MESLAIILKLHTPEELILYSNIAHWIEGALFLIIAGIALVQVFGYLESKNALYFQGYILLVSGLFLPIFAFAHHFNELALAWQATIYDSQQLQHTIMAILLAIAGSAEIAYLRGQGNKLFLRLAFPLVLVIIGIMFINHPQHGTSVAVLRAATIHWYLGIVLILAAVFKSLEVLKGTTKKWFALPWILFLVIAAVLLISYREPDGAYRVEPSMNQNIQEINHNNI